MHKSAKNLGQSLLIYQWKQINKEFNFTKLNNFDADITSIVMEFQNKEYPTAKNLARNKNHILFSKIDRSANLKKYRILVLKKMDDACSFLLEKRRYYVCKNIVFK